MSCDEKYILGYTDYILRFPSMVRFDKIYGIQFHPEKVALMAYKSFKKNFIKVLKCFFKKNYSNFNFKKMMN